MASALWNLMDSSGEGCQFVGIYEDQQGVRSHPRNVKKACMRVADNALVVAPEFVVGALVSSR